MYGSDPLQEVFFENRDSSGAGREKSAVIFCRKLQSFGLEKRWELTKIQQKKKRQIRRSPENSQQEQKKIPYAGTMALLRMWS